MRTHISIVVIALLALSTLFAPAALGATEHCPDHNGHPGKVEGGNLNDVVLDAGTVFCVKGSTDATGVLTADGETTLFEYLGNGHDVSYYVVYEEVATSSPTPTPIVTPIPTPPAPTPTPTPTAPPSVEPSPTPTTTPTESDRPNPTAVGESPEPTPPSTDTITVANEPGSPYWLIIAAMLITTGALLARRPHPRR